MNTLLVLLVLSALFYAAKKTERRKSEPPPPRDRLDEPLMHWTARDVFTKRELLRSISIMGAAGSGKTSAIGLMLGRALAAMMNVSLLIIASKPEDRAMWEGIAAAAGRKLLVFGPKEPLRFNLIACEARAGADAREITECLLTTTEALTRNEGRSSDAFWGFQDRRMIQCAVEVIKQAYADVTTWSIQQFINDAPTSRDQIQSEEWKKGYFCTTIAKAHEGEKTHIERQDLSLAMQFWLNEYPQMADKTRSSINASVLGRLHVFNSGIVRELIGTETTISPEIFDKGAMVLIDMPVANYGLSGTVIGGAWKYATQRHILRRAAGPETAVTCIWIDEYQNFLTGFDSNFLAECRSHFGCMAVLTQSLHSFFSSMGGGHEAESKTKALLTNFGTKVFMTLGDEESAKYASSLVGQSIIRLANSSRSGGAKVYDEILGDYTLSTSLNEQIAELILPRLFMNGLKTGGPENGFIAEGWVVRNGQSFSNGENAMLLGFSQR
jgi:type IV secretory pathway TraG/TraD family ATPase VirD4